MMKRKYLEEMAKAWGDEKKVVEIQAEAMNVATSKIADIFNNIDVSDLPFYLASMELVLNNIKTAKPGAAELAEICLRNANAVFVLMEIKKPVKQAPKIKELTEEEAKQLVCSAKPGKVKKVEFTPYGLFYTTDVGPDGELIYTGYDNSTGDCWCECFDRLEECLSWLRSEIEVND